MVVLSVRHRGLRKLLEQDDPGFLQATKVDRVRKILTALIASRSIHAFVEGSPPGWRVHRLSGARQGVWSIAVSRNWRITFVEENGFLSQLNLEDYH